MKEQKKCVPEIRFAGFTDDWEQRKLGDISQSYSGGTPSVGISSFYGGSIPFIRSGEINDEKTELFLTEKGLHNSSAKLVKYGDILYALYGATSGEVNRSKINGAINQAILAIIPNLDYCVEFIAQWLRKNKLNIISTYLQGGQGNLSAEIVKNLQIILPDSKEEQTAIGNFFKQLDDTIALHRRNCIKCQNLKMAYLESIFSAKYIHYKDRNKNAWEQRKLGEIVEIVGGGTPDTSIPEYWNGSIDWYSPTEIGNQIYVQSSTKKITSLGLQKSSAKLLPPHRTILFTSRAGIGDMAILVNQGSTNQGFQSFVVDNNIDVYFLYSLGYKIKEYALKNASGSTFLEISKNTLSKMGLFIPSLEEQTAIGNFFKQLDDTIALHQREVEKYKKIKQAYLEKMFI